MKARTVTLRGLSIRDETIVELPDGRWLRTLVGRYYKTAAGALAAIKRHDRAAGVSTMTVLEWRPRSRMGRAIVLALGAQVRQSGSR